VTRIKIEILTSNFVMTGVSMEDEKGGLEEKDATKLIVDLILFIKNLKKEKFILRLKELLTKAHKLEEIKNSRILNQTNQLPEAEKKFIKAQNKFLEKCAKHGVKIDNHKELLSSENLAPFFRISPDL
jgi:hypothetical protein